VVADRGRTVVAVARVVVISDVYKRGNSSLGGGDLAFRLAGGPAPADLVADTVAVVVLGELPTADIGLEMAGWLASFLGEGKIVVVAYSVRPDSGQVQLLNRIGGVDVMRVVDRGQQVRGSAPAFEEYFTLFGVSGVEIASARDGVVTDPLGWLPDGSSGGQSNPAAARFLIGRGSLYVVPFHAADLVTSHDALVPVLLRSVESHQTAAGDPNLIPAYLDGIRLPGEQDRLDAVARLTAQLEAERAETGRLRSFRAVLGSASGAGLERLVIEALNIILGATAYEAVDRPDTGAEDFWIVGPEGDFALVEVKGINTSVRRSHINQVDDHRSRLGRDDGNRRAC
jgi:hypothetical protein